MRSRTPDNLSLRSGLVLLAMLGQGAGKRTRRLAPGALTDGALIEGALLGSRRIGVLARFSATPVAACRGGAVPGPINGAMLRSGHAVALCTLALLTLGVLMVTSAGLNVRPIGTGGVTDATNASSSLHMVEAVLLSRSAMYMALALTLMWFVSVLPVRHLARLAQTHRDNRAMMVAMGLTIVVMLFILALVYVPGLGRAVNGSHRWIEVNVPGAGAVSIQPSELVKWGMVGLIAWYCVARAGQINQFRKGLLPGLAILGLLSAVVVLEDLGTGVLIAAVGCIVMLAAGCRFWHFLTFAPLGLLGVGLAIWTSPYRIERLISFLDPYADPADSGYHMIQSLGAISGGGGFGRGLGHGIQKLGYLPEDQTDFLFAVICEELGIAGAVLVAALLAGLLWFGLSIVRQERVVLLKLVGLGVLMTIGLQAVMNLFVVTGLGPTKGIALPLLSSGGTGWVLTAGSLGLLIGMDRHHARRAEAVDAMTAVESAEAELDEPLPTPEVVIVHSTAPRARHE
jgi:cell division protein FtsW